MDGSLLPYTHNVFMSDLRVASWCWLVSWSVSWCAVCDLSVVGSVPEAPFFFPSLVSLVLLSLFPFPASFYCSRHGLSRQVMGQGYGSTS
jgi:hypothetical protein